MLHERRGAEQELAAADRDAEHDDAGPDGTEPAEAFGARRDWQLGELPVPIGLQLKTQRSRLKQRLHAVSV